jgi:hypothetical protein
VAAVKCCFSGLFFGLLARQLTIMLCDGCSVAEALDQVLTASAGGRISAISNTEHVMPLFLLFPLFGLSGVATARLFGRSGMAGGLLFLAPLEPASLLVWAWFKRGLHFQPRTQGSSPCFKRH